MIVINCTKGLIDARECQLHITGGGHVSGPDNIDYNQPYNLEITSLDKEKNINFVIMQFSDKGRANFVYRYIVNAVKDGKEYVDLHGFEEEESRLQEESGEI